MKVQIQKKLLLSALEKMYTVSTKALLPDFNLSGRVTIEVKKSKVIFTSSNGFIHVNCEITDTDDPGITNNTPGIVTTDSVKLRDSVKLIKTEDISTPIELTDDGQALVIKDTSAKRTKLVKLPRENQHHKTSIITKPDGDSLFFETDHFISGVKTVLPFQSKAGYKLEYQVVCFHWVGKDVRLICGDGAVFAVFTTSRHSKDANKRELKRTMPCNQLAVLADLISECSEIEMVWKDKSSMWVKTNTGMEVFVRGLPDVDYIAYDTNAFRFDEATALTDVKVEDLKEAAELLGVLRDKEKEEQGKPHTFHWVSPSADGFMKLEIKQDQGKFSCEYEIPALYYNLNNKPVFKSLYAQWFFDSFTHAAKNPYLRFYFIEEVGVVNVRDVDLGSNDDNGIPLIKENVSGTSLSFFFAAIREENNEPEED